MYFSSKHAPKIGSVVLVALFAALLSLCASSTVVAQGDGAMPYKLQWKYLVPDALQATVAESDSLVFIANRSGRLVALRRTDGVQVWTRRDLGPIYRAPIVWQGRVLVADAWGMVRSLHADTGGEEWVFHHLGRGDCALAQFDSTLYVSAANGWLYALSTRGQERWRARLGAGGALGIDVSDGVVYTGTGRGFVGFRSDDGQRVIERDIGAVATAQPRVVGEDVVVASGDGYVRLYDSRSGQRRWEQWLGAKVHEPIILSGKHVVCVADNGYVYALGLQDGQTVWRRRLEGGAAGGAVKGLQGELVVGSGTDALAGIDPRTGDLIWSTVMGRGGGVRVGGLRAGLWAVADDQYAYVLGPLMWGAREVGDQTWWELWARDKKMGYRYEKVVSRSGGGWRVEEGDVDWRGGFRRGARTLEVDEDFYPIWMRESTVDGNQAIEEVASWDGGIVAIEQRLAGHVQRDSAVFADDVVDRSIMWHKLVAEGRLLPDRIDSLLVFDWGTRQSYWIHLDMGLEKIVEGERLVEVVVGQRNGAGQETRYWVDRQGRVARAWQPSRGVEQRRVERRRAERWSRPAADRHIALDRAIDFPAELDQLVVELPDVVANVDEWLVEDAWQRVEIDTMGRRLLRLEKRRPPQIESTLPFNDASLKPYLLPSLYVQSDDVRMRALADSLRGDARDVWTVAMRLRRWVYDHMDPRDTNVRFKSAVEVLEDMEGTCSEYAALYMALCRAADIPVRASVGWVIGPQGNLILHIWCQIYAGEWVDVDPSQSGEVVGAGYIKTGNGLLTMQGLRQLSAPLSRWIDAVDTLQVTAYSKGKRRYLRSAAELFAAAELAERNFEEERAIELYHQVDMLPWSDRSAPALVQIGRYRLRRGEWADAGWALERLMRREPHGDYADDALFHMAKLAEARGDSAEALLRWHAIVSDFADSDLADDALGQLAARIERRDGCMAALPYYAQLRERYSRSGWAAVASSAIERCR